MFENHSGSILPWEWRMPDREHGVVFRQQAKEKSRFRYQERQRIELCDLNFVSVPTLKVIRRT